MELTIGISSCGRPEKLRRCIDSLRSSIKGQFNILIVDSMPNESNRAFAKKMNNMELLEFESPIGPSQARYELNPTTLLIKI
jgi:chemotaxis response regulator CheB